MAELSLKVFCSYSHKDEFLREELDKHLSPFIHSDIISIWHDRKILAGEVWDDEIKNNLKTADIILLLISADFLAADIILLLISADFLASKYCWEVEVNTAIERHKAKEACVIPIILRSVYWKYPPLSLAQIQALPKNAQAITTWTDTDEAFTNVVEGIWAAAEQLKQVREKRQQEEVEKIQKQEETEGLQKQEAERLRLKREQKEAEIIGKQQEAERLQSQQEKVERIQKQQETERLERQQKQEEAERLKRQKEQEEIEWRRREQETDDLSFDKGLDYTRLRDLLKAGQWKEADLETLQVMLKAAGREKEGWLDIESIERFPCTDLRTIDQLWILYSKGLFGFSVQKRIYESVRKDYEKFSEKFGDRVGWRTGMFFNKEWLDYDKLTFSLNAPQGHLPVSGVWGSKGSFGGGGGSWRVSSLASKLVKCNI